MAKYHINSKGEPGLCRAKVACPFGDLENDHFASKDEAAQAYEAKMSQSELPESPKRGPMEPVNEQELAVIVETATFEEIEEFANQSPKAHEILEKVIDTRAEDVLQRFRKLAEINPYENKESDCDINTYKSLKRELDAFKDKTATMVEAYVESKHYKPAYEEMDEAQAAQVGAAIGKTAYDPNTAEWLRERHDTVGGSDVGSLVLIDFQDPEKIMGWDHAALRRIEQSKRVMIDQTGIDKQIKASKTGQGGPLYRGNMWEDRHRDKFAKNHPEYKVMNTKNQYYNPDAPWQQVNFDGVLSDREDGQPTGILELKTGNDPKKWDDGVPLNYRAQVLYYLNATKLDYAIVGAQINDGEFRYFKLNREDAVAPGKYDKPMSAYIDERVEPWFNELKASRAA